MIRIIAILGKIDIEDKVHVVKKGAGDYITKPYNHRKLWARAEVPLRKSSVYSSHSGEKVWGWLKGLVYHLENGTTR